MSKQEKQIKSLLEENAQLKQEIERLNQVIASLTKKPINQSIQWSDIVRNFFNKHVFSYDETKDVASQMDLFCAFMDTNYKVRGKKSSGKVTPVYYTCTTQYPKCGTIELSNKDGMKIISNATINRLTKMNPQPDSEELDMGLINALFNTKKATTSEVARHLIHSATTNAGFEDLTDVENIINSQHVRGAPCYIKEKNLLVPKGYSYDINSHHPYLLANKDLIVPVRAPKEYKYIASVDDIDDTIPAIYCLKNVNDLPYFTQLDNNKNRHKIFYTNYEIQRFRLCGATFELFGKREWSPDEDWNCIMYEKHDCVSIATLMGSTIEKLYENKSDKACKATIQHMLGYLTQKRICGKTYSIEDDDIAIEVEDGEVYGDIKCADLVGTVEIETAETSMLDTARIKIFFYDYLRLDMYNRYIKNMPEIYRIKSDSIMYADKIPQELISDKLGDLKREAIFTNIVYPHANIAFPDSVKKTAVEEDMDEDLGNDVSTNKLVRYDRESNVSYYSKDKDKYTFRSGTYTMGKF